QYAQFARAHSLILNDDHLLFRDGATERRVPYTSIEQLSVRGTFNTVRLIGIKCRDLPEDTVYGYEGLSRLAKFLRRKAPQAALKIGGLLTLNTAFRDGRS